MDIKINTAKKKRRKYRFVSVVSILVFLGIWYIATAVLELVPAYSLPSPVKVFSTLITKFYTQAPDGATLPQHFLYMHHLLSEDLYIPSLPLPLLLMP